MLENIAIVNLTEIITEKVEDPTQLRAIKEIAASVLEGMPIKDSCLLARVEPDTFDKWVEVVPEIGKYMEIQRLTYKSKLIKTLNQQATINGDFKIALQLLVANFPTEFNPAIQKENSKNKRPEEQDNSVLEEVFSLIQKSDSSTVNREQQEEEKETSKIKNVIDSILS